MKKLLLTFATLAAASSAASAQVELGLKLSPSINYFRVDAPSEFNFKEESGRVGLGGGLVVDYFFGENAAFSTGLWLTGKSGEFSYSDPGPLLAGNKVKKQMGIQYLELPITVKLFTNEIAPDIRLYFQVGGTIAAPIGARIDGEKRYIDPGTLSETTALKHVFFFDANALVSIGAEYQLGKSTKTFAGISYHRGLINLDSYFDDERKGDFGDNVSIKNNVFALDLGLKF
jgi:hypothetical protein